MSGGMSSVGQAVPTFKRFILALILMKSGYCRDHVVRGFLLKIQKGLGQES